MVTTGIEALRRGILQEAEAMARQEVEQAHHSSKEELERARREAEAEGEAILRQAEREADALRRRMASVAELESKRRWLEVRERLIRRVLDRTLELLREAAGTEPHREVLLRLLVEAAREAGGGKLKVRAAAADARLVNRELLEEARRLLAQEGISAELEPAAGPAEMAGGVIVVEGEGRVVVDNSLEARRERQEALLRSGIWRILSGE